MVFVCVDSVYSFFLCLVRVRVSFLSRMVCWWKVSVFRFVWFVVCLYFSVDVRFRFLVFIVVMILFVEVLCIGVLVGFWLVLVVGVYYVFLI